MIMFGTDNITLKKLNHAGLPKGHDVITIENGIAVVDEDWCIGCGVCASQCDFDAINIIYREDVDNKDKNQVQIDFETLHNKIRAENKIKNI